MELRRREFLGTAVGTAGTLAAGGLLQGAAMPPDAIPVVPLGPTLRVSQVGFGTGMRGGNRQTNQTRLGRPKFEDLIRYNYDLGIRLYDTADIYGSHPYVVRALQGKPRDTYAITSKYWFRPGGLPEKERPDADVAVARFLKEMGTDYIDLVQIHCVTKPGWPQELRRQMDLLDELKHKGLIRAHGVSCHSLEALQAAAAEPWVDVIHARINSEGVRMDVPPKDSPLEKVVPVLRQAHAAGKGIIGMKVVGEGTFRTDPEKRLRSIRYVMGLGCVDVMIVGFEKPAEVDDFLTLARRPAPGQA